MFFIHVLFVSLQLFVIKSVLQFCKAPVIFLCPAHENEILY